jgi:hypothetical protein
MYTKISEKYNVRRGKDGEEEYRTSCLHEGIQS